MSTPAGRIALVAGAASGIGAAVARRLHAEGARVFCADLDLAGARATASSLAGATALPLDVRLEDSWRAAFDAVLSEAGPPHVFVNSVGVSAASPLAETTFEEWRRVLSVNLDGAFLGTKHALRALADGGAIVHVGSASGLRPAAGAAAYSTSKAGLRMLVRAAAKECRETGRNVRVNLVSPAGVKTPMWRSMPFFQELVQEHGLGGRRVRGALGIRRRPVRGARRDRAHRVLPRVRRRGARHGRGPAGGRRLRALRAASARRKSERPGRDGASAPAATASNASPSAAATCRASIVWISRRSSMKTSRPSFRIAIEGEEGDSP